MADFSNMTPEELDAWIAEREGKISSPATVETPRKRKEPRSDRLRGQATAVSSGATFGWGDEISSGLAATMAKLAGDKKSWGEIYEDIHGAETARQKTYEELHPGEALALNVAGGIATGGMGAARALPAATKALPRVLGSRAGKFGAEAAIMGSEGALAGAGFANPGERLEGAKVGAAMGTVAGGGLKLAGKALKGLTTRNQAVPDLIQNGKKIPLHLAVPKGQSRMAGFYRDTVGGSWGGGGSLARQERPFLEGAEQLTRQADQIKFKYENEKLARQISDITDVKQAKKARNKTLRSARKTAERATDAEDASVRKLILDDAMPAEMNPAKRQQILGMEPQKAAKELDTWWNNNGFQMVKGRTFDWNADLGANLRTLISDNPWLALELGDAAKRVKGMTATLQKLTSSISDDAALSMPMKLDGEALMAMRNVFAIAAGKATDPTRATSLLAVKNQFDDMIRSQLGASDRLLGTKTLDAFEDHMTRWGSERTFLNNVTKAKKKGGYFTADDAMAELKKSKKIAFGEGRHQEQITAAVTAREARKKGLAQLKENLIDQKDADDLARAIKNKQQNLSKARTAARQRLDLKKQVKETNQRKLGEHSVFEKIARTSILGGGPALSLFGLSGATGAMALPMGMGVSTVLAQHPVQRFMVGQTGLQKGLANVLRRREKELEAIRRGYYRSAAMQAQE